MSTVNEFAPIPNTRYEASRTNGAVRLIGRNRLRYGTLENGYRKIQLPEFDPVLGKEVLKNKGIHQWIAAAWLGEAQGREVDHIDGNRSNNSLDNLRYVTGSENIQNMLINKRKRDSSMQLPYSPKKVNSFNNLKFGDQIWVMNGKNIAHNIYIYVSCNKKSDKYIFMNTTTGAATVLNANHLTIENWFMYEYTDDFKSYFNQVNRVIIENI